MLGGGLNSLPQIVDGGGTWKVKLVTFLAGAAVGWYTTGLEHTLFDRNTRRIVHDNWKRMGKISTNKYRSYRDDRDNTVPDDLDLDAYDRLMDDMRKVNRTVSRS